jgi:hypothetical protein
VFVTGTDPVTPNGCGREKGTPMRSGIRIIRLCGLLAAFVALSAMAGCPKSSDLQDNSRRGEGPQDHPGPGAESRSMGGGMGMP